VGHVAAAAVGRAGCNDACNPPYIQAESTQSGGASRGCEQITHKRAIGSGLLEADGRASSLLAVCEFPSGGGSFAGDIRWTTWPALIRPCRPAPRTDWRLRRLQPSRTDRRLRWLRRHRMAWRLRRLRRHRMAWRLRRLRRHRTAHRLRRLRLPRIGPRPRLVTKGPLPRRWSRQAIATPTIYGL